MTEENKVDVSKYELAYQPLNILNVIIALLIPTAVGYLSIVLLTNLFTFISRGLWSIPVIWPEILFLGGLLGGLLGGMIAITEVAFFHYKDRKITSGKTLPSDLYYIGVLVVFTYVLEFFSESLLLQVVMFLLELGFFAVLGWNMSKLSLETRISVRKDAILSTGISPVDESSIADAETE